MLFGKELNDRWNGHIKWRPTIAFTLYASPAAGSSPGEAGRSVIIMKTTILLIMMIASIAWGTEQQSNSGRVATNSLDTIRLSLELDKTYLLKQPNVDGIQIAVGNVNNTISIVQIGEDGRTPIGIDISSNNSARITTSRYDATNDIQTIDIDGDGIAESKIVRHRDGKLSIYRLKTIEWELVKEEK